MSAMEIMDDALWDAIVDGTEDKQRYLFLEPHPKLKRQWKVEAFDETHTARLDGAISRFGAVSLWGYERFAEAAEEVGYRPIFMQDPSEDFAWLESLNADPGVEVTSKLEGRVDRNGKPLRLIRGFLPFQAQGINFMKACERMVYAQWSTGTGKTLFAEGTILWKKEQGYGPQKNQGFDVAFLVVKPNNLVNSMRKLKEHTGLDARILSGTPKRREKIFAETAYKMEQGEQPILIFNAEKCREDTEFLKLLVEDKNILVIFDEMPSKYAHRTTALYRATAEVLYTSFTVPQQGKSKSKKVFYPRKGEERAAEMFAVAMSATPIYSSPEDVFNCVRMCDPTIFGSIDNFNNTFVGRRDQWGNILNWRNLDLMGSMLAHVVHQADKTTDPEIKAQFPEKLPPETDFCDMDSASEKLYSKLQDEYRKLTKRDFSVLSFEEILAAIGCLQMLCNNPRSVLISAKLREEYNEKLDDFMATKPSKTEIAEFEKRYREGSEVALKLVTLVGDDSKFTDEDAKGNCIVSKMLKLQERIEGHDDKMIVFSAMNETLLPLISEWLDKWGVTHVCYHGMLSDREKQEAQDSFRTDPSIKVFLSTDAGSDSIDLPEATLTIHYDDPWTKAAKTQRANRQDRIDSVKDIVQEVTLRVPNTVEDRKAEIIAIKAGYQTAVFSGEIADQAEQIRGKSDFLYILLGEEAA